jgi:hypothetical protein
MSNFLSDKTARIFFRILGFIVITASSYLWFLDKLTNSQIGYVCAAVVVVFFPKAFALRIMKWLTNRFSNNKCNHDAS